MRAQQIDQGKEIMNQFGARLGKFLSPIVQEYKPQSISFGGIIGSQLELFKDGLKRKIGSDINLSVPPDEDNTFLFGAARLFDDDYWKRDISPILPLMR